MTPVLAFGVVAFGSIFSIVDPVAAVPVYLALTGRDTELARKRAALRASVTCFCVLAVFAAVGPALFRFFGITVPAFRIAGGILLFAVALEMLHAKMSHTKTTPAEESEGAAKEDVGIIPVGIPLLSGPGSIATVMVLGQGAKGGGQLAALYVAVALVSVSVWIVLRFASGVARILGTTGMHLVQRIMGLILAAVSVQFVLDGVHEAFPKLFATAVGG